MTNTEPLDTDTERTSSTRLRFVVKLAALITGVLTAYAAISRLRDKSTIAPPREYSPTDPAERDASVSDSPGPTVTFGASALDTVIEQFGWETNDNELIVDVNGTPVKARDGDTITASEFGGVVPDDTGEPTPIRDDITSILDYVKSERNPQ